MEFIRTKVSGSKKRYIDDKFNLDLSYITPRIIAMAFPASGFKTLYRNNIEDVSKFLNEKHNDNFLVLNLSGNHYNKSMFKGNVIDCDEWNDHHSPPLHLLFDLVYKIHDFLMKDINNVSVINCNAGKGRTGTLICCYLLFSGKFSNPNDAFDYYSLKRFNTGLGVTNPSQKRYVKYFYELITKQKIFYFPNVKFLKKIFINDTPYSEYKSLIPKYTIYHCNKIIQEISEEKEIKIKNKINGNNNSNFMDNCEIIADNKDSDSDNDEINENIHNNLEINDNEIIENENDINEDENNLICFAYLTKKLYGDIEIELLTRNKIKNKKLGRIAFNTAFLDKDLLEMRFYQREIDPYSFSVKKRVTKGYHITLKFEKNCDCLNTDSNIENICENCKKILKDEIKNFEEINKIINLYRNDIEKGKILLFGDSEDDVEKILKERKILKKNPQKDRRNSEEKNKEKCLII